MNANILTILTLLVTTNASGILRHSHLNPVDNSVNGSRIVGGVNTVISKFPHQISIQNFESHICGGSIISEEWVVTAAHCVNQTEGKSLTIRSGSTLTSEGGTVHKLTEIIIHEEYYLDMFLTPHNDIALIRVETLFKLNGRTRRAIKLMDAGKKLTPGTLAYVTGWGIIKEGHAAVPWVLQKTRVPIVSITRCKDLISTLQQGEVCAGYEGGGQDSCQGDSGGPLTVQKLLVGVVSHGEGCAKPRKFGVYAEVAYYRDWIKNKTGI